MSAASSTAPATTAPFRILVVEDNPAFVEFLRESLLSLSTELEVSVATQLSAAIAALTVQSFDAVLLDLNLPDSSGLQTLQRVTAANTHVPIVVLTGIDDARQAQDAMRLGAQDWLTKGQPDPELVLRALRYAAERKRLTEGLIRSQKLEAVGLLARNVAHELNNLLTVIMGNAGLAASSDDARARERALADVEQAVRQGALLTRQLLGIARPHPARPLGARVRQAIETVHDLCAAVLPRSMALSMDIRDEPIVPLAQEQLEQVLLNLVLNARDALPRGGTIMLRTRRTADAPNHAQVRIEVSDTGTGIRPEILPHVFEPFFTTKGDAGTGLGLMIVKDIIEHAGGAIRVESQYGKGTTIAIDLPEDPVNPI
jgi:two-component system, cell cycle sensor histidine kinase and response regulator CckA